MHVSLLLAGVTCDIALGMSESGPMLYPKAPHSQAVVWSHNDLCVAKGDLTAFGFPSPPPVLGGISITSMQ